MTLCEQCVHVRQLLEDGAEYNPPYLRISESGLKLHGAGRRGMATLSTNLGTNVPDAAAPNFKDPGSQCEGSNSLHDSVKDSVSRRSNGQCQLVLQLAAWLAVMASYGRGYTCEPSCALRHALFAYHVSSTFSLILIQLVLCLPQVLVQTCHVRDSGTSSTLA